MLSSISDFQNALPLSESTQESLAGLWTSDLPPSIAEADFPNLLFTFGYEQEIVDEDESLSQQNIDISNQEDQHPGKKISAEPPTNRLNPDIGDFFARIPVSNASLILQNGSPQVTLSSFQPPASNIQPEEVRALSVPPSDTEIIPPTFLPSSRLATPAAFSGRIQKSTEWATEIPEFSSLVMDATPALSNPDGHKRTVSVHDSLFTLPAGNSSAENIQSEQGIVLQQDQETSSPESIELPSVNTSPETPVPSVVPHKLSPVTGNSFATERPAFIQSPYTESLTSHSVQKIETLLENSSLSPGREIGIRINPHSREGMNPADVQPVDLYINQRGRTMHFSVHTADHSLAGEMKASLLDLSSRLTQQGYQGDLRTHVQDVPSVQLIGRMTEHDSAFQAGQHHEAPQKDPYGNTPGEQSPNEQESSQQDRWFAQWEQEIFAPLHPSRKEFR